MSNQLQDDGSFINSIVGEGTSFSGELELNGLLRVDGDFTGTIRTRGKVLVGINGRAECTINAGTVVIGGVVKGNIHADEKVLILSTGMMIGNIRTPRLIAEEGVVFHGNCLVRTEAAPVEQIGLETEKVGLHVESAPVNAADSADEAEQVVPSSEKVYTGASEGER